MSFLQPDVILSKTKMFRYFEFAHVCRMVLKSHIITNHVKLKLIIVAFRTTYTVLALDANLPSELISPSNPS